MLSSHADPWFSMPPTDPCRPPAMPLTASAIAVVDLDVSVGEGGRFRLEAPWSRKRGSDKESVAEDGVKEGCQK